MPHTAELNRGNLIWESRSVKVECSDCLNCWICLLGRNQFLVLAIFVESVKNLLVKMAKFWNHYDGYQWSFDKEIYWSWKPILCDFNSVSPKKILDSGHLYLSYGSILTIRPIRSVVFLLECTSWKILWFFLKR